MNEITVFGEYGIHRDNKRDTARLIKAGAYAGVNMLIKPETFPIRVPDVAGERRIVIVGYDTPNNVDANEVIRDSQRLKLSRPDYEDAFFFGEQYPEVQLEAPVVFLHEGYSWGGHRFYLVLDAEKGRRTLRLVNAGGMWRGTNRFAFVSS